MGTRLIETFPNPIRVTTMRLPGGIRLDELSANPASVIRSIVSSTYLLLPTSLTLAHKISPSQYDELFFDGVPPPRWLFIVSPNGTHCQLNGNSRRDLSESPIDGDFSPLISPAFTSLAFSFEIRFSNSPAGSSFESWGTSLPSTSRSTIKRPSRAIA